MLIVKAYAKLNLNLHILPQKLANGYSEIKAVNCRLSLFDELSFEKQKGKIELIDESGVKPEENTVYKAAAFLKKESGKKNLGIRIKLIKNIPVKAGLGGESADAAAALIVLNKLWQLNYSLEKLSAIGGKIGSDIFYCLHEGIGEVGGFGEKVEILPFSLPEIWGVIVLPKETKPSTKWAYENLNRKLVGQNLFKRPKLLQGLKDKNKKEIIANLHNDFELLMAEQFPVIKKIKTDFKKSGALNSLMAGAGLAVVGFFENKNLAEKAIKLLGEKYKKVFIIKTI
jgi:4-diphosphocytidyl-2-C-methyl-D-erythritol kinase